MDYREFKPKTKITINGSLNPAVGDCVFALAAHCALLYKTANSNNWIGIANTAYHGRKTG